MRILITGSEGLIGKIISQQLRENHTLTCIDKKLGSDIIRDDIMPYFSQIETLIHLAGNPSPFIKEDEAEENIEIARRVINACEKSKSIERIINASSINVYPYIDIFESGKHMTSKTPLFANKRFGDGSYGRAKIEIEKLFEEYCRKNNKSLLNLRIGYVAKDNLPYRENGRLPTAIDYEIFLSHQDMIKIIKRGIQYKGIGNYVCVSKRNGDIDKSITFPLD